MLMLDVLALPHQRFLPRTLCVKEAQRVIRVSRTPLVLLCLLSFPKLGHLAVFLSGVLDSRFDEIRDASRWPLIKRERKRCCAVQQATQIVDEFFKRQRRSPEND